MLLVVLGGSVWHKKNKQVEVVSICPTDTMMCPDGTTVPRTGLSCEFGVCKQELPSYLIEPAKKDISLVSSTSLVATTPSENNTKNDLFSTITNTVSSLFQNVTKYSTERASSDLSVTKQTTQQPFSKKGSAVAPPSTQVTGMSETRYQVENGKIIAQDKTIIYTLPTVSANDGTGSTNSSTHTVNAVPVANVVPIINGIPVNGLPGKYYLSENTVVNTATCEFSNKIYILDTTTNEKTLLYEENNTTLRSDDTRACASEMYLLATDNEKLIMKYHTIGTNTICDSTWSEPEKTWYLDVTHISVGTKRYFITSPLYLQAEKEEVACRLQYKATTTETLPTVNG